MAHPKTIESFDTVLGEKGEWKRRYEKGNEVTTQAKKELIAKDENKVTRVDSVYRIRTEDNSEFICWNQTVTGHTGIGNEISYEEGWDDLCRWYEPIVTKEIVYDAEKQEQIVKTKFDDIAQTKVHYLYPFSKANIDMIQKITQSNIRCLWYVRDLYGITRVVKDFKDWSTKDFDTLITFRPSQSLTADTLQQHLQQTYH